MASEIEDRCMIRAASSTYYFGFVWAEGRWMSAYGNRVMFMGVIGGHHGRDTALAMYDKLVRWGEASEPDGPQ